MLVQEDRDDGRQVEEEEERVTVNTDNEDENDNSSWVEPTSITIMLERENDISDNVSISILPTVSHCDSSASFDAPLESTCLTASFLMLSSHTVLSLF